MRKNTFRVNARENEVLLWTGKCVTNGSSNPDGLSDTVASVTRTAAGKYTVLLDSELRCPQILYPEVSLVGAAGYDCYVTSVDKDAQATGTITCDTKANTTDDDYFTLHDGYQSWTVVLDVGGTGDGTGLGDIVVDISGATTAADVSALLYTDLAASGILMTPVDASGSVTLTQVVTGNKGNVSQQGTQNLSNSWAVTDMTGGIDGVYGLKFETWAKEAVDIAATGTITCDTKANTTQGDYLVLNDGQQRYGFELDVAGTGALRAVTGVAATGTLTCDTKANSTDLDYFVLNDGQNKAMLWYNVAGTTAAKYSKTGSQSVVTLTCDTKANTADEGYADIWDGNRTWRVMMDVAGNGDSTGLADVVCNVSGATTAADIVAIIVADVNKVATVDANMHLVAAAASNDVVFTCSVSGYAGNGSCALGGSLANAWATTNAIGGTDPFPAEEFAELDISGATTAADVSAIIHTAIAALTEVRITSTDATGSVTLVNDEKGPLGNCSQQFSETGSTLMALTDMTGGTDPVTGVDVWTNVDISGDTTAADISATLFAAINATDIQITAADGTGSVTLTNDSTGPHGNAQQYEVASNAWAIEDMTGGAAGAANVASDTNNYDVYLKLEMRNSKRTFR